MSDTEQTSEEEVYARWLDWVNENLGRNSSRAAAAARAAAGVAMQGGAFALAEEAARESWAESAPALGRLKLPVWGVVGAISAVTVLAAAAVVVFATPAGCGIAQKMGFKVDGTRCPAINTVATGAITSPITSPSGKPQTSPRATPPAIPYSPPATQPIPSAEPTPQPTHNPLYPPYEYPASTGLPPMSINASTAVGGVVGTCRLPVFAGGSGSGGFISFPDGSFVADPRSSVAYPAGAPSPPQGMGMGPSPFGLTYDKAYTKWLPVGYSDVSPDGKHYAYGTQQEIVVVNVADGTFTQMGSGHWWLVLDVESDGLYAVQQGNAGLWFFSLTGTPTQLTADGYWQAIGGGAAYGTATSAVPQGASNVILRFDLSTKTSQPWFQIDGGQSNVIGFDAKGVPLIQSNAYTGGYQGNWSELWLAPSAGGATVIIDSYALNFIGGFSAVISDSHGIWLGSGNAIYLYNASGLQRVANIGGTLAGDCA